MVLGGLIARVHAWAGRRRSMRRLAVLIRNQCNCVIRYAFNDGNEIRGNGEARLVALLARRSSIVLDVGANIGDWTAEVLASSPGCRIVLFDASSEAVERLVVRFAGLDRVQVVHKGVSDRPGRLTFHEEPGAGKTSSFVAAFSQPGAATREVDVTTIDEALEARSITHVDLLKVDVEGLDMHVLRGAERVLSRRGVDAIQFEYNAPWANTGATLGEAVSKLTQWGYAVLVVKSDGLYTFDYKRWGEFFGYANFVAVAPSVMPDVSPLIVGSI